MRGAKEWRPTRALGEVARCGAMAALLFAIALVADGAFGWLDGAADVSRLSDRSWWWGAGADRFEPRAGGDGAQDGLRAALVPRLPARFTPDRGRFPASIVSAVALRNGHPVIGMNAGAEPQDELSPTFDDHRPRVIRGPPAPTTGAARA